jgi:hypothetical protein
MEKKIYIVCEDYTCAFEGIFNDEEKANALAKLVGGYVCEYTINENGVVDSDDDKDDE